MLSIHERVSKQDESEREIKEEIIHPLLMLKEPLYRVRRFLQVLVSLSRNILLIVK